MEKRNIPISLPSMGVEEWEALREPIESGWITQGPKVKEFEKMFAERHHVKHALPVSNCTTTLHLALVACGVKPGDKVIVPAFTWVATVNVVMSCGATPVFNIQQGDFPGAFSADQQSMSIPLHNKMVKEDYDYIIHQLKKIDN